MVTSGKFAPRRLPPPSGAVQGKNSITKTRLARSSGRREVLWAKCDEGDSAEGVD